MTEKHFVLATAGHVDHGKSALVKALTGTDPDRLPEEKARGITIDLGFAELNLIGPNNEKFHIGIVDVPGHEDFVRNMIAGVGSIDLALLVVAADDGWMPQTEEHLQILVYLWVKCVVVALTKSDLGNIDIVTNQISEELRDTPFANSLIVPTSVHTGAGLEDLKRALASDFAALAPARDIGKPRIFVDRAFSLRGIGTVVTGTLTGGRIQRGQNAVIQPHGRAARIRSIQSHNRDLEIADPGARTAINLPDLPVGPGGVQRGDVTTIVDVGEPSDTIDVLLEKSVRLKRNIFAGRAPKNGSSVHLHHGTTRTAAKIVLLDKEALEPGEFVIAQMRLESPILAFIGDRFVVRNPSEQHTIAGGVVLDPDGDRANFRSAAQSEFLKKRAANIDDVDLCIRSQLARVGFVKTETLLSKSHFSQKEIASALSRLHKSGDIVLRKEIAANAVHWRDLILGATALIDQAHEQHPEQRGLELTKLRADLGVESDELFAAMISELSANGFERAEHRIARGSHRATLPPEIQQAAEKILSRLAAKPFDPPGRKELAPDRQSQKALQFLIEQGEVLELNNEIVLLRDAAEQMRSAAVDFISKHGPATASQLRQKIGTSRRVIIPFLEYLDRARVTRRVGDARQLREQNSADVAQP
jgi:selenocysteine-specific elongation factor